MNLICSTIPPWNQNLTAILLQNLLYNHQKIKGDQSVYLVFLYCKQLFSFKHAIIYYFGLEPEAISIQYPTRDFTYYQHISSLKPSAF